MKYLLEIDFPFEGKYVCYFESKRAAFSKLTWFEYEGFEILDWHVIEVQNA